FAAKDASVDATTIRSTLRRTSSAASSGRPLRLLLGKPELEGDVLSLDPFKLVQLLPERPQSTALPEAVLGSRIPMRKIFPVCCASADKQSAKNMAQRVRAVMFLFMRHSSLAPLLTRGRDRPCERPPAQIRT